MAIGKRKFERVISDQLHMSDANVSGHRVHIQSANACPLVDAVGACAGTPELSGVIATRGLIAPGYLQYAFSPFQRDVRWRVVQEF